MAAMGLPTGTVTFLLTDVEGSTRALQRHGDVDVAGAAATGRPDRRRGASATVGVRPEEQGEGDSVLAVFSRAADALAAAVEAQRTLGAEPWPDGTRAARPHGGAHRHSGAARRTELHRPGRAPRRPGAGPGPRGPDPRHRQRRPHSSATTSPTATDLRDLGEHRLRDLTRGERLHQVVGDGLLDDFPPLRGPRRRSPQPPQSPLTNFIGRDAEVAERRPRWSPPTAW